MAQFDDTSILGGAGAFPPTDWSMIRGCQDPGDTASQASLETLFRKYWKPVYFFVRRYWEGNPEQAKDLTQAFFLDILQRNSVDLVSPEKGRFRTFVCAALRHFLSNQKRAAGALKRRPPGGAPCSLDGLGLEQRSFDVPAADGQSPEALLLTDWKQAVIQATIQALTRRAAELGPRKTQLVELFLAYDLDRTPEQKLTYRDLAESSGLTIHQVTIGLHWARREFESLFVQEVAQQVSTAEELEEELREVFGISRRSDGAQAP